MTDKERQAHALENARQMEAAETQVQLAADLLLSSSEQVMHALAMFDDARTVYSDTVVAKFLPDDPSDADVFQKHEDVIDNLFARAVHEQARINTKFEWAKAALKAWSIQECYNLRIKQMLFTKAKAELLKDYKAKQEKDE